MYDNPHSSTDASFVCNLAVLLGPFTFKTLLCRRTRTENILEHHRCSMLLQCFNKILVMSLQTSSANLSTANLSTVMFTRS